MEDLRNAGVVNGKPAVLVIVFRQPGANIIETVDRVRGSLPQLNAAIPRAINSGGSRSYPDHPRVASRRRTNVDLVVGVEWCLVVFIFCEMSGRRSFQASQFRCR